MTIAERNVAMYCQNSTELVNYKTVQLIDAGDCTEILPGCTTIWNTDVRQLYLQMVSGVAQTDELQEVCR